MDYCGLDVEVAALEAELAEARGERRLAVLTTLAWYLRQRDTRRALVLADEAEALRAAEQGIDGTESQRIGARLTLVRAEASWLFGQLDEAARLAAEALQRFEAIQDLVGSGDAHLVLAGMSPDRGQPALAKVAYDAAMAAYAAAGAAMRARIAEALEAREAVVIDHQAARSRWGLRLGGGDADEHLGLGAIVEGFWAHFNHAEGRWSEVIAGFQRSHELALAAGMLRTAIFAAGNTAEFYRRLGDFATAFEWAERGLGLARPTGWPMMLGMSLMRVASILRVLDQREAARDALREAMVVLEPFPTSAYRAIACSVMGEVALDLKDDEGALQWYAETERVARRLGRPLLVRDGLCGQAHALSRLGRPREAVAALEECLPSGDETGYQLQRGEALRAYAEIARRHGLPLPAGSTAPSAPIHYLQQALATLSEIQDYVVPVELLTELSRDYEAVGEPVHALEYERRAAVVREQTHAKRVTNLATSMQVRQGTERAKAEVAHHKALAEAEARRADAEASANQAKSAFLANMSHELRSPLNAMLGFTRLLLREPQLSEQAQGDLAIVLRSGEHLYGLINQVLEVSKVEAGRVSLTESECDLYALLDELSEMFAPALRAKGLQWQVENDAEVPQYIQTDAVKLRQVLINLLSNAVKFTQHGAIELRVGVAAGAGASSEAEASPEGLARVVVSFAVTDTGAGIAAEEMSQLGTAFYQAQAGRRAAEGTGLGLTISRSFVRLMGGELRLSSTVGEGTRAHFELPVQVLAAPLGLRAAVPRRRVVGLAAGSGRPRILAVDDRAESRLLLVRLLRPLGFEVREASNGQEALALWEQWRPQLILMDMRMPVLGGREATRRIKATEQGQATCVIALTASSFEEQREEMLALGCDDFLRKPFREEVLLELLGRQLGVEFVYEEAAAPVGGEAEVDAQRLARLPAALREQLQAAVEQLDVQALEAALDATRAHDAAAAAALTLLAKRFQYERIRELLLKDSASDGEPLANLAGSA